MTFRFLLFIVTITAPFAWGQAWCTGFGNGVVGNEYIKEHFSPAVVRVQDVGTAYLIDSERGYLLTAGHVLDDLAAKHEALEVVLGDAPYTHFGFTVRKRPPNFDIALLQLTQPDALKSLRALDIAFDPPNYDASLFAMGYPQYGDQGNIFLRSGDVKLHAYPPNGLVEITHTTVGGSSGGPLIDAFGDAVATCQEKTAENQVGRYLLVAAIESVLDQIPVSSRMQNIEKGLIGGTTGVDGFKELLKKANPQSPTNLELYNWIHHLGISASSMSIMRIYLRCPLMPALVERHIPEALLPFVASLPPDQAGELKLALAQREYTVGHTDLAASLTRESLEAFSHGNLEPASHSRGKALLFERAIEQQNKLGNAQVVGQDAVQVVVTLDTGAVEKYLVQWVGLVDSSKVEEGHSADPGRGWNADTRQCHWRIRSGVERKVYYLNQDGQVSNDDAISERFASGFGNKGSDYIFRELRPENCNDNEDHYTSDLSNARSAVGNKFPSIIADDRQRLVNELRALPHVVNVTLLSSDNPRIK